MQGPRLDASGQGRSSTRGVHLQHMDATDATRDAHIAASKAFVHDRENCGSEEPQTLFPDPLVGTRTTVRQYGDAACVARPSVLQRDRRPHTGSIRFVQKGGQTISSARLEATRANTQLTPGAYQTPLRNVAASDIHPSSPFLAASESNYSQYTSSLPSTPMNKQHINKTWSASQLRNKEIFGDAAASTIMARNTIHNGSAPRRTIMSQRHWPRPPSKGSLRNKSTSTSTFGNTSLRVVTEAAKPTTHPFGQPVYFKDAVTTGYPAQEYSATQRQPLLAVPSLQNPHNRCIQRQPKTDVIVERATIPPPCPTTSRSFLRTHRKRNFSFSSNDDDKFSAAPSTINSSHKRLSLRSPRTEQKGIRKSLRQIQPLTPRPSILPDRLVPDISTQERVEGFENESSNTGSLRRTASRVSKRVKMRLRSFWNHSKNDCGSEQVPDQHIEAPMLGEVFSGQEFMSERAMRLSFSNDLHTSSEYNGSGTVVHEEYGAAQAAQSEASGETSRFTSWSSSVRRASPTTSNRQATSEFASQHLPVIAEGNGQAEVSTPISASRVERHNGTHHPPQTQQTQPKSAAPRKLTDRDAELLASGIRMRRAALVSPSSSSSSSSSSPSLASSGRGATPRQAIAPAALRRLQELSLNLENVCREESRGNTAKGQTSSNDPFYDGDKAMNVLFAFQSAPTTPAGPSLPEPQRSSPVASGQAVVSPQYFFRGKSPFQRALRESMKTFEGETSASRAQKRDQVHGGVGSPAGLGLPVLAHVKKLKEAEDDAPLLQSDGSGQWSRVQAWKAGLIHDSSTRSDSAHSPRGKGQEHSPATDNPGLRTVISQSLCTSAASLDCGTARTPVARSVQLGRLHRDTVVSPEQLRVWMNQSVDMEEMGSPWSKATPGHTRENAEHAEHDDSMA